MAHRQRQPRVSLPIASAGRPRPTSESNPVEGDAGGTLREYTEHAAELHRADPLFRKLEIETHLGCNRRCTYCFLATEKRANYAEHSGSIMEWPLYETLLAQLTDLGFDGILCFHFYDEPLLNPLIEQFVAAAAHQLPRTRRVIYTNGDRLTESRFASLRLAGTDLVYVTRHDNQVNERLRHIMRSDPDGIALDTRRDMQLNNRGGYLGPQTDPRIRRLPCIYPSESPIITIAGNVLPCSVDFRETMRLGNIKNEHLRDIFWSTKAVAFRRSLLEGGREHHALCVDCDYYADIIGANSTAEQHRQRDQPFARSRTPGST